MTKDCCKQIKNKKLKRSGVDAFLIWITSITLLILGAVFYFGLKTNQAKTVTKDTKVEVVVENNRHDWGVIDINGGVVRQSFPIENKGESVLKLYDLKTSCMCTTAQIKIGDKVSRKFGMHEKTSQVFEVNSGETAEVIVEFDPLYHGPSGIGQISREVNVSTNDPQNPELSFLLTAKVVKK